MQRQITRLPTGSLANGLVQPHRNMPSPAFRVRRSPLSVATAVAVAVGPVVGGSGVVRRQLSADALLWVRLWGRRRCRGPDRGRLVLWRVGLPVLL